MTFIGWIDYSSMMIAVHKTENSFMCLKYVGGSKISGAQKECLTKQELANFLLSLPGSPTVKIHAFLNQLCTT